MLQLQYFLDYHQAKLRKQLWGRLHLPQSVASIFAFSNKGAADPRARCKREKPAAGTPEGPRREITNPLLSDLNTQVPVGIIYVITVRLEAVTRYTNKVYRCCAGQ